MTKDSPMQTSENQTRGNDADQRSSHDRRIFDDNLLDGTDRRILPERRRKDLRPQIRKGQGEA